MKSYADGVKLEIKGRKLLDEAMRTLEKARNMKSNGLGLIKPEYKFLMGDEPIHPHVNGEYVMTRIITGIMNEFDEEVVRTILKAKEESERTC